MMDVRRGIEVPDIRMMDATLSRRSVEIEAGNYGRWYRLSER